MRKTIALTAAAALTAGLGLFAAGPAGAATCATPTGCDTTVTFTIASGGLSIAVPDSVALNSGSPLTLNLSNNQVTGSMGTVTVTDNRGGLALNGWSVSASGTDFTTTEKDTSGNPLGTITADKGTIASAAITPVVGLSGVGVLTGGSVNLKTGGAVLTATATLGNNQATYQPTVTVTIPSNAIPGDYTGTITQTVS